MNKIKHPKKTNVGKNSKFNFIKDLGGLCKGHCHLFLAGTGKGKTSVMMSIARDLSQSNKILYLSTEEKKDDWDFYVARSEYDYSNVIFFREESICIKNKINGNSVQLFSKFVECLIKLIDENECDVLFLDNLTTSRFYDSKKPDDQNDIFRILKRTIETLDLPLFMVAHTSADSQKNNKIINSQDIRGSKQPSNQSEVLWCFQNELISNEGKEFFFPTIMVEKDRIGDTSQNVYHLEFDKEKRTYVGDRKISWQNISDNRANMARFGSSRKEKKKELNLDGFLK